VGARQEARAALAVAGLRPRKRWGQHFLCDPGVARRIVEAADLDPHGVALEIGPGLGALTEELARRVGHLYLVEIDRALAARLAAQYAGHPHVHVIAGDALALSLAEVVGGAEFSVVANLPYNVASPVVFRLLELRDRVRRAVLMLQKEMAARLAAKPGGHDYGAASVLVQAVAEVRTLFTVSRRSFLPPPEVDSVVIELRPSREPRVELGDTPSFRAVVRAAFGQRRKMLRNALAGLAAERGLDAGGLAQALVRAGVAPTDRAERLDLAAFARVTRALER
jgi:16S rRNA (adenine1518-N6/adenine1519-N6)-dimethyltransferase